MYRSDEQLFDIIERIRSGKGNTSKAAAVVKAPCDMMVGNNPDRKSKAASTGNQKYQTVVTEHHYNMGTSTSSDNIVYQCGTHNFETKNLKEFNEHVARLPHNDSSKAASSVKENKAKVIYDFLNSKQY